MKFSTAYALSLALVTTVHGLPINLAPRNIPLQDPSPTPNIRYQKRGQVPAFSGRIMVPGVPRPPPMPMMKPPTGPPLGATRSLPTMKMPGGMPTSPKLMNQAATMQHHEAPPAAAMNSKAMAMTTPGGFKSPKTEMIVNQLGGIIGGVGSFGMGAMNLAATVASIKANKEATAKQEKLQEEANAQQAALLAQAQQQQQQQPQQGAPTGGDPNTGGAGLLPQELPTKEEVAAALQANQITQAQADQINQLIDQQNAAQGAAPSASSAAPPPLSPPSASGSAAPPLYPPSGSSAAPSTGGAASSAPVGAAPQPASGTSSPDDPSGAPSPDASAVPQ